MIESVSTFGYNGIGELLVEKTLYPVWDEGLFFYTFFHYPTGSLDSRNGQEIIKLLKESHHKYQQTLILVTHDENIALQADRIVTIVDGKIVRDGQVARP